jgi:hypothetical protein
MSSLGEFFPEDYREKLALENLKKGAVIRVEVLDTVPPKIKRLIIVGIDESKTPIATIFINSEINPYVLATQELQKLQHRLESSRCPFLDHDSFADCSKIKERMYSEIFELIKDQPSAHMGELSQEDWDLIKNLLKSSRTIPIRIKKKYGLFF